MVKAKCTAKYRDKNGKIVEYGLVDSTGKHQKVNAYQLKMNIKSGLIEVSNLKLTSDGRLIEIKGAAEPIKHNTPRGSKLHTDIAKAIIVLSDSMRGMGEYLEDEVENAYSAAGMRLKPFEYEDDFTYDQEIVFPRAGEEHNYYYNMYVKVIRHMLQTNPGEFIWPYIDTYDDYVNILCESLVHHDAFEANRHPIIKALELITEYTKSLVSQGKLDKGYYAKIKSVKDTVSNIDLQACKVGYFIGYTFINHLDKTYFGVISNDAFTVGRVMTSDDNENGLGAYVCHAGLDRYRGYKDNSGYSIAFNTMSNGLVRARIIHYVRQLQDSVWIHKDTGVYIDIDRKTQDLRTVSCKLAIALNKLAAKRLEELNKK